MKQIFKEIGVLLILLFCPIQMCMSQNKDDEKYQIARQYYEADINSKSLALLSELASKDNVKTLNFIGDLCYSCYYFDDISKTIKYKEKAANKGYAFAQYDLAKVYHTDDKFIDKEKGIYWAEKALQSYKKQAERGDIKAFDKIGDLYASGWLTNGANIKEGIEWWEKAANQGNSEAMWALGNTYYGNENIEKAHYYYLKGAKMDDLDCQVGLGTIIYNYGKNHPEWVDGFSLYCTGLFMDEGGVNPWYTKAANEGCEFAEASIGYSNYLEGHFDEAKKWLEKAKKRDVTMTHAQKIDVILGAISFFLKNTSMTIDNDDLYNLGYTKSNIYVVVTRNNKKGVAKIDYNGNYIDMVVPYLYNYISIKEIDSTDEVFFICEDDTGKKCIISKNGKKEEYIDFCDLFKKYNF